MESTLSGLCVVCGTVVSTSLGGMAGRRIPVMDLSTEPVMRRRLGADGCGRTSEARTPVFDAE